MRPTRRLMLLVLGLAAVTLFAPAATFWNIAIAVVIGVALFDVVVLFNTPSPQVTRKISPNLPVNRHAEVVLEFANPSGRVLSFDVNDEVPANTSGPVEYQRVQLQPDQRGDVHYRLHADRRGDGEFGRVALMIDSMLGFWQLRRRIHCPDAVRVYPDFAVIARYLELVSERHTQRIGIKLNQRRGEGLEFHQLREYREGDSIRQIDWKATSRRRELISREYQEERDQRVIFLIDSGRRMRARDGMLSHFDHALNAMLLLAYIALRQGDTVGLNVFGPARKKVPSLRGVSAINALLNEVYDLHTGAEAADFVTAAEEMMKSQQKRALVVVMTNLREEDDDLAPALRLIRRRHVVLLANLRESVIDETLEGPVRDLGEALKVSGAHRYIQQRRLAGAAYASQVQVALDCTPEQLPLQVVNGYWQIKRSGEL